MNFRVMKRLAENVTRMKEQMRNRIFLIKQFLIVLVLLLVSACGMLPDKGRVLTSGHAPDKGAPLSNPGSVKKALYSQYQEWRSVKYRYGGLSKKGVDCSGFVYLTYQSKFGIKLPRTTAQQARAGGEVRQHNLRAGDLVFFKTGMSAKHVGIYLENRKFVHASTSKGVMISSLDDYYWSRKYWKSVRVQN